MHMASEFLALQINLPDAQTGAAGGLAKTSGLHHLVCGYQY